MTRLHAAVLACAVLPFAASRSSAQSDTSWEKTYAVSAHPTLQFEVGDSSLQVHSCAGCRSVHVHITAEGTKLSRYNLEESQSGDTVHLSFKEKPYTSWGIHMNLHTHVVVDVETPPEVNLQAAAGDGSVAVRGLHGTVSLMTGDGSQTAQDVSGDLRFHSGDGSISVTHASGTLDAHLGDGHLDAEGVFSGLQLHAADGHLHVALDDGSHLTKPSSIQASDGSVTLQFPKSFPAELDLHTGDGKIDSALPLAVEGFNSGSGHSLHGKLDGGGALLSIRTGDGSIRLSRS